VYNGRVRCWF